MYKIKLVSFDIYDTLVKRILSTEELYCLMEEIMHRNGLFFIDNFCRKRIEAQKCLPASKRYHFSLHDIYETEMFAGLTDVQKQYLEELETECEMQNTYPDRNGKKLYEKYKGNCRVICTSDMYLNSGALKKMLERHGYIPEKLFVSCEYRKSKKEKTIFQELFQMYDCSPRQCLHIGDALRSDCLYPKMSGTRTRLISKNGRISDDYYYNFGYHILGPVIYEFCNWLQRKAGKKRLLFLAREGETFGKFYHFLFDEPSTVLYVSRSAVIKGILYDYLEKYSFCELYRNMSREHMEEVGSFCRRIGTDDERIFAVLKKDGIDRQDRMNPGVFACFEKNKKIFREYLKEDNINFKKYLFSVLQKGDILVDLGWRGTMQNMLQEIVALNGFDWKLEGAYLGVFESKQKQGFLFQTNDRIAHDVLCFSGILEIVLMPVHGSVIGYRTENDSCNPVFCENEFSDMSRKRIKAIQKGVMRLLRDLKNYAGLSCFDRDRIVDSLIKFGCRPNRRAIEAFRNFEFYDNGICKKLIEKPEWKRLFIKGEIKNFANSRWKTGYCKDRFKIPMPYHDFIYLMKKVL